MMQKHVYSFDIFDTALVRIWAKPTDLFWELGTQLQQAQLIQISPQAWHRLRVEAESAARHRTSTGEVTLQQIYEQLTPVCGWSAAEVDKVMQYEIQLERSSLLPVPANQRKIQELRRQNHPIAFLSDMYLPTEVIRGFLADHQIWLEGDVLHVSGDVGVNKGSGKLFQHHLAQYQLSVSQLYHTGDNLHSDVEVPRKLGIQSQAFLQTHLNRYEQMIADDEQLPLRFRSLLAGTSRLCRLHCPETDLHRQTIWNTTSNVTAPIFFGFVHWVLVEAQRQGIQRLYFMARDGHILYKIAQIICRKWNYDIDCRYFYGSRQAFHFPSIQEIGETEFTWIFDTPQFFSVRVACDRVNLPPEKIADTLNSHGFPAEKWDQNLTQQEVTALKAVFQKQSVADLIFNLAATYREKALGYFKQEGMGDGVPFATVDTGWSGKSQRSLSKLLAAGEIYPSTGLRGFFFGLTGSVKAYSTDHLIPYFLEAEALSERCVLCDFQMIELFLSADHGSTVRYEKQQQRYVPVLRSETNESGIAWGVLVQHHAMEDFTERLTDALSPEDCNLQDFHKVTEALLKTFMRRPSKEESNTFGAQAFSQHQSESKFYDLAPAYSLTDGFRMLVDQQYVHGFAWLPASIQRSSPLTRIPLGYIKRVRSSHTYAWLNWRAFKEGKHQQSWEFARKAIRAFPPILLSRRFIHTNFSLAARTILKPRAG
jgi:FMN phosphatase YigB (HAD superfamily)